VKKIWGIEVFMGSAEALENEGRIARELEVQDST
jgi:hypothetical protein